MKLIRAKLLLLLPLLALAELKAAGWEVAHHLETDVCDQSRLQI